MKRIVYVFIMIISVFQLVQSQKPSVLRLRTYLTPSIPEKLYRILAEQIEKVTGIETILSVETVHSGPQKNQVDPFTTGEIDIGFFCSPPYIWLASKIPSPIELLSVAPVFYDERNGGKPLYFSDVVVRADSLVTSFSGLLGARWCYNDQESLSGYFCTLQKLAAIGEDKTFFKQFIQSESHLMSLQWIVDGKVDAAAIDSTTLALQLKSNPELAKKIKVIESWGPFPIQPIVIRASLLTEIKQQLVESLLALNNNARLKNDYLLDGFASISDVDFDEERQLLKMGEHLINLSSII